ncbi:hypothetical protein CBR_g28009 [Chara braunii]|uniref:Uncharacterized protein n=1 Tax=Chara braunii TaxID=69332 RepID=A0A388L905_CHABU|nr:hypothetical protein CBR_g28009 [Chara braunii]|eukprot:GBG78785.1 hypothetical protein CBR_g28009 [Chara braunii]
MVRCRDTMSVATMEEETMTVAGAAGITTAIGTLAAGSGATAAIAAMVAIGRLVVTVLAADMSTELQGSGRPPASIAGSPDTMLTSVPCHGGTKGRSATDDGGESSEPPIGVLETKVAEIGKSVAAVCQYVEVEKQKKAAKERRKVEKKQAEERVAAELAEAELKKKKKAEKARKEAERNEEIRKCLDIKLALRAGELRDEVREDVWQEIHVAIGELCTAVARGKQAAGPTMATAGSGASSSKTDEINLRTRDLCITDKTKRGLEPTLEGSPPMELPPKRTPRRSGRLARTRGNALKTPTPKKTPPSIRKKTPAAIGIVGRLRFEKKVMNGLKNLDALVLQNICKDEGIAYYSKFESIFDIAAHRTRVAYGSDDEDEATSDIGGAEDTTKDQEDVSST